MRYLFFVLLLVVTGMSLNVRGQIIATPRIYYHEEKLQGNPIETAQINLEVFNYIIQNALSGNFVVPERSKMVLVNGEFDFVDIDQFKYATVRKDGISYTTDEGSFYLPEAVIFFDNSDYNPYPSEFYFVAKIKDQLELCHCSGGEGIKWYQLPDRYDGVADSSIIEKTNNTISVLRDFIEYEAEQRKEAEVEK